MPTNVKASIDFSTPLRFSRNDNIHHEEHEEKGHAERSRSISSSMDSRLKVNAEGREYTLG